MNKVTDRVVMFSGSAAESKQYFKLRKYIALSY